MTSAESAPAFELTPEQEYEFDLRGYIVLRRHYDEEALDEFHAGIDELQAIPVKYETYRKLGIASYQLLAMKDPQHPLWQDGYRKGRQPNPRTRVDHALCGTDGFDRIARDSVLKAIHTTLAGGAIFISSSYYIEKLGPAAGGGFHSGGYPVNRDMYYAYDHTNDRFACKSTKSVVILSDMTSVEKGQFAAIPGSHKANFSCPFEMHDARENPLAVPVLAAPGDVIIFSEGMTHTAFPVTDDSIRRSVFFTYMPATGSSNLPDRRMSIYPDHVLERLSDQSDILTSAGYI